MNRKLLESGWRTWLAYSYIIICLYDFCIGPVIFNFLQYYNPGQSVTAWTAVTLQGGGLYHLSVGAILGISAHGRTQEKLASTKDIPTEL